MFKIIGWYLSGIIFINYFMKLYVENKIVVNKTSLKVESKIFYTD